MEIHDIQVFDVPNIYSLREPVVKIQVKLGDLVDTPTKDIGNINHKIIELFPGIKDHKCSTGYVGGFVDRLWEGTYLAHVTEHLCLETQRMLGYDIKYGKARQVKDDIYSVIFSCNHPAVGKACGKFVINTLSALIDGREVNIKDDLKELKRLCIKHDIGVSTGAIISEAKRRGIPVSLVNDGELVRLGYGNNQKFISATLYEGTSSISVDIACDKQLTRTILDDASIPVPGGKVCESIEETVNAAQDIGFPVVLKPKSGNKGKHVFVNINSQNELKVAYEQAKTFDGEVIVEKYVEGKDYRLLVVDGKMIAAAERVPAHVTGDGKRSIEELIEEENKNDLRGEDHEKPLTKIKVDDNLIRFLHEKGIKLTDIPDKNEIIILRQNANLSTGGIAIDCTDAVHPKNKEAAELAAKAIGLDIAGIDMVIPDISMPIKRGFGAIVEINAAPGIRMHLNPTRGIKRDVVSPILDMIYPKGSQYTIPIVSITGTNGKTTTTRMISSILAQHGYKVGTTTSQGIYINNRCIEEGDTTGPRSARRVLNNREVEAAVLETARGGILRDGLAYEKADVAVFTNFTEDHIGVNGINTMEELLNAKSLVVEAVKEQGACVLNADDRWVMKIKDKAGGKLILFSMDHNNPHIIEHIKNGGDAVFKKDSDIHITRNYWEEKFMSIDDIPATMGGILRHNIYNSMAAIGTCSFLGINHATIREALHKFSCDEDSNRGRFNIFDLGDFKVVLDFGHNIDGYRFTIEGLKGLNPSRLVGIIRVPGDRKNDHASKIAKLCAHSFDEIIIREDQDLRGRRPYEVAELLLSDIINSGFSRDKVRIILDEKQALKYAISNAAKSDVIVAFFEKMDPLVRIIEEYRNDKEYFNGVDPYLLEHHNMVSIEEIQGTNI